MSDKRATPPKPDAGVEQARGADPITGGQPNDERRKEWAEQDREVELIQQTVTPKSDAPSRAGITGYGSGADSEKG